MPCKMWRTCSWCVGKSICKSQCDHQECVGSCWILSTSLSSKSFEWGFEYSLFQQSILPFALLTVDNKKVLFQTKKGEKILLSCLVHFVRFCNPKEMMMILKPDPTWIAGYLRWTCHFCSFAVSSMQYFTCVDSSRIHHDKEKKTGNGNGFFRTSYDYRLYHLYSIHRLCNLPELHYCFLQSKEVSMGTWWPKRMMSANFGIPKLPAKYDILYRLLHQLQ